MKRIIAFVAVLLVLTMLAGCGGEEPVQAEEATVPATEQYEMTKTLDTAPVEVPEEPRAEQSTIEDVAAYYQAAYPEGEISCIFRDFDGNGYGDLAVCRNASYLGIYFMDEHDVVSNIVLFDKAEFTFLYAYWGPEEDPAKAVPNIFGTYELENNGPAGIYTFYAIADDGSLYIRDRIKYEENGVEWKWFAAENSDWVSITEETYREILGYYWADAEDPKPIEEYYLR